MGIVIEPTFFQDEDVVSLARQLLGKKLCTYIDNKLTTGMIVETEAYKAPEDPASHAYNNRRTQRTETMFKEGGTIYIYLIYGIYHLFNIVTAREGVAHAVLVRAVSPLEGMEIMLERRKLSKLQKNITAGPGLLTQALGISIKENGLSLTPNHIWVEYYKEIEETNVLASPRVGLGKTVFEPYLSAPWRFRIKDNKYTSAAK